MKDNIFKCARYSSSSVFGGSHAASLFLLSEVHLKGGDAVRNPKVKAGP
jgi:hypothetical protein